MIFEIAILKERRNDQLAAYRVMSLNVLISF